MRGPSDGPRVLVLGLGWFPDSRGGLDRYVGELVSRMAETVAVVIGPAAAAPARVHAVSSHDAALSSRLRAVARAATAVSGVTDVVDAHFALYAALPLLIGRLRRRPLVVHFHGPWADEVALQNRGSSLAYGARRAVERAVGRRAAAVVVLSDAFASVVVEHMEVSRSRVVVIPPGVDRDHFSPGSKARAREQLGLPPDAWVAVAVRRLVPRTGVDVLIDAWDALASDPGAVLVIAGDGPARADLVERARPHGDRVRFMGAVTDDDLVELYRAADVCVVPSRALEGFGLVVLEALSCGTPVLVTDVGGLREAVAGLGDDLVVPPDRPADLGARLVGARDGSRPLPAPDACRASTAASSWDAVVARHRAVYRRVGSGGRRPRVRFVDHTARPSGGEIAMVRTVEALVRAPGVMGADVAVTLFEPGPIAAMLRAVGASVEVSTMGRAARDLPRSRVGPGRVPLRALGEAGVQVGRLARSLRRDRPDIVHANSLKSGMIAGVACRVTGVPMIWHVRDRIAPDYLPVAAVRMLRWVIPRLAAGVVTPAAVVETLDLPARIPVGVVVDPYRPPPREGPPRGTAPSGELRIGIVGRLAPWKGQDVFVEAFARAFPADGATGVVAGGALFGEDEWECRIRDLVHEHGLDERIDLAGHVDDVPALLDRLDVLVHASVIPEPHGQVVVEGMAAGLAVVASATGGPAEIVTDGVDGLLVPPGDPDALAAALRRLAADPALRARLGAAAQRRATDFDPDRVVPQLRAIYERVLGRRRRTQ